MSRMILVVAGALNIVVGTIPPIDVISGVCFAVGGVCLLLAVIG